MKRSRGKNEAAVAAAAMAAEGLAAAVTGAAMVAGENTRRIAMQSHTSSPSHAAGKGDSFSAYNIMRLPPWFGLRSCDVGTGVMGRSRMAAIRQVMVMCPQRDWRRDVGTGPTCERQPPDGE